MQKVNLLTYILFKNRIKNCTNLDTPQKQKPQTGLLFYELIASKLQCSIIRVRCRVRTVTNGAGGSAGRTVAESLSFLIAVVFPGSASAPIGFGIARAGFTENSKVLIARRARSAFVHVVIPGPELAGSTAPAALRSAGHVGFPIVGL